MQTAYCESMRSHRRLVAWVAVAMPLAVILGAMAVPANGRGALAPASQEPDPIAAQDLAFFTVAYEGDLWGPECGQRVNVVRTDTAGAVLSDHAGGSLLWQIRSAPNLDVVVGGFWGWYSHVSSAGSWGSIQVLQRSPDSWDQWAVARTVVGAPFYTGIDIMPDGNTLVVATSARTPLDEPTAPFRIEKYLLSEMTVMPPGAGQSPTHRLGPARGVLQLPDPVASIFVDPDGRRAHLLTRSTDGSGRLTVRTIAVATMTEPHPSINLPLSSSYSPYPPTFLTTMASLSPDARYLVTTGGMRPEINVADLVERRSWSLTVQDAVAVTDVSFSHGPQNAGLLALNLGLSPDASARPTPWPHHGRIQAMIGELHVDHIAELGRGPVHGPWWLGRPAAIEWTADGSGVLAGGESRHVSGNTRVSLLDVDDDGRRVSTLRELELCANRAGVRSGYPDRQRLHADGYDHADTIGQPQPVADNHFDADSEREPDAHGYGDPHSDRDPATGADLPAAHFARAVQSRVRALRYRARDRHVELDDRAEDRGREGSRTDVRGADRPGTRPQPGGRRALRPRGRGRARAHERARPDRGSDPQPAGAQRHPHRQGAARPRWASFRARATLSATRRC